MTSLSQETRPRDLTAQVVKAAEALVKSITFDDSGENGRGGNGGLISRDTIKRADEVRMLLLRWRKLHG